MNLNIVDITPLPVKVCSTVNKPPNIKEFNYKSIVIEDDGKYYYWSRGISINISKQEYEQVRCNPKLYYSSTSFQLHERVNQVLKVSKHDE